ncbi:Kef-type potassium/proton antiporter, CPA2 family [Dehalogenimonas alkenigignens]|uniref:Kef-type potassium/proton antiporter, CPA2 family n=1 Tax=Dehalogenimonas alkenigignens TaxID=1217799 RepID=A0A0W0GKB2_9CHLR|nr:cation:proton antiporter [Dehalogenimonas alkenigignens]KTB49017.1 Kef-type potassium/proton antiporter, CPA2 family [Dehalogenimonas alkenigignens]
MESLGLGFEIIIVLVAAVAGGVLAHRLRLPVLLGYLLAGMLVSPHGLGLVQDTAAIEGLAQIGVVLLLFTLGLEFSLDELRKIGAVAVLGGIAQILLTALAGFGLGSALGWPVAESIFFGFLISLSSTLIVLKLLLERGEFDSCHGRIMTGILLVQDLSLVPLMIILPTLGTTGADVGPALLEAGRNALGFIVVMLGAGLFLLPKVLDRVARARSRELFLISVVSLSLAAAIAAAFFGVSAAVGAFIAGLLIGRSVFARQALADIVPFRDAFGALFFVSLGTLADLSFITANPGLIIGVVAFIIAVKFFICAAIPWIFGYNARTALFTGFGLTQIGEFSFVLAGVGVAAGILRETTYALTLGAAITTMVLTPFVMSAAHFAYRQLEKFRFGQRMLSLRADESNHAVQPLSGHTIICGGGRTSDTLVKVLSRRKLAYLIIDLDPQVIKRLRRASVPSIYGDASNPEILACAGLEKAKLLVCTFPSFLDVEITVKNARSVNPRIDIVARVERDRDAETLRNIGVNELVKPQFEASLEITRHALHRYGVNATEIQYLLNSLRQGTMS